MWSAAGKGFIERRLISMFSVELDLHIDAVEKSISYRVLRQNCKDILFKLYLCKFIRLVKGNVISIFSVQSSVQRC